MSGILAVVLDAEHQVVSIESDSRHLIGTKVVVVLPPGSEAERSIFRVSGTERSIADLYHKEELVERRHLDWRAVPCPESSCAHCGAQEVAWATMRATSARGVFRCRLIGRPDEFSAKLSF